MQRVWFELQPQHDATFIAVSRSLGDLRPVSCGDKLSATNNISLFAGIYIKFLGVEILPLKAILPEAFL